MEVKINENKLLSDNWYKLYRVTFDYISDGVERHTQIREVYDRGNGAAILLYCPIKRTIILTSQFRIPTYLNGNKDGMMIEVCAGLLDDDHPEDCIKREAEEETGYKVKKVNKIFEAYMSPGSVTEILHFFIAEYNQDMKIGEGGGLPEEQENIEVLEMDFETAYEMIASGQIIDAKTIMLLQYAKINNLV